jgi:hypothetical protein
LSTYKLLLSEYHEEALSPQSPDAIAFAGKWEAHPTLRALIDRYMLLLLLLLLLPATHGWQKHEVGHWWFLLTDKCHLYAVIRSNGLANTTVIWNMECGLGQVLGFTVEGINFVLGLNEYSAPSICRFSVIISVSLMIAALRSLLSPLFFRPFANCHHSLHRLLASPCLNNQDGLRHGRTHGL